MARANNVSDFKHNMDQLSTRAKEYTDTYFSRTTKERQYMLYCKYLKGCTTHSMSESLNAAGIEPKYKNPLKSWLNFNMAIDRHLIATLGGPRLQRPSTIRLVFRPDSLMK